MESETASPTPPPGGTLYALTPAQRAAFLTLSAMPNGGITFDGATFSALPFIPPIPFDYSNFDNLDKSLKAIGLVIANFTGKTPAQVKAAFLIAYQSLNGG